jgi:ATP-dependent DNA helicase UvrD/PcrA
MADKFTPNARQQAAIEHVSGPMLVLAGAGTGKTTVLVERIAWLIEHGHARPDEILAITFTENAAGELKSRVERRLRRRAPIWAGTFHAYCFAILKRYGKEFHVLPPEDIYVFLRQRIDQLQLERFIKPADLGQFLEDLRNFFDRCLEELVSPQEFQSWVDSLGLGPGMPRNCRSKDVDQFGQEEIIARWQEIARAYANAMRLLEQENLGAFGMMISGAVHLLESDARLLGEERARARFIMIDEFQDSNSSNILLTKLLAGSEHNVFAVGDPDQAIYRFRGASSAAFEEFQRLFPQTRGVILDENQRSRGHILRVAFAAIDQNPHVRSTVAGVNFERLPLQSGRARRDLEMGRFAFDEPVEAVLGGGDEPEAADIADEILRFQAMRTEKEPLSLAVLYRSHFHREKMIEALAARGISFLVKSMDVMETPMARDLLSLMRAITNEGDADSLFRICALPEFAVAPAELRTKLASAGRDRSFEDVLQMVEKGKSVLVAVHAARDFVAEHKLTASGAMTYLVRQFALPEGDPVVRAFARFVAEWELKPFMCAKSLSEFLQYLDYFRLGGGMIPMLSEAEMVEAEEENPDAVRLMTVHGAKGLEFSHVWVLRAIAPGFPVSYREPLFEFPAALRSSIAVGDSKEVNEQEERRLFYVAITRARDRLAIHSRPGRGQDRTPPGFLRPMLSNRALAESLVSRPAVCGTPSRKAEFEISPVGSWMLMPPEFKADELSLSAHAVESYSTCPLKFKLEKDWRIPGDAAAAMQFGSAIHTVLRQYYDPAPHAPKLSVEEAVERFQGEFAKALIEDPLQRSLYEDLGARQLRTLLDSEPRGSVDVVAAELPFNFPLSGRKITGRIDRIDRISDNVVRVIDYKTGAPKTPRYAEDSLQLSIYAMGARALGFVPQELEFLNLQNNEHMATTRTAAHLERARQRIEDAANGMAAGRFPAKPGQHCQWCDYRRLCPATEQRVFIPARTLVAVSGGGQ